MKFRFKYLFIMVVMCVALFGCSSSNQKTKVLDFHEYKDAAGKTYDIENDYLAFHFDCDTTQFSVKNKETGYTWYSNPQNAANDAAASAEAKNQLQSTFTLKYTTNQDVPGTLDNYSNSIATKHYKVEKLDNGVKVTYTVGKIDKVYIFPYAAPEERMKLFLDKMTKSDQTKLSQYYRKIDINNLRTTDNKAELVKKYPDLEKQPVYVLRDTKNASLKDQVAELFKKAGYTQDDYKADIERYNIDITADTPQFNVSVYYTLDNKDFLVNIPMKEVEYKDTFPAIEISLLPYMGAGSTQDKGYMLVPDGSGGIINFNNGKSKQPTYYANMYGWDYGLSRKDVVDETVARFPMFGIENNGESMICTSEKGSSYAIAEASVSGTNSSYNSAKFTYTLVHGENLDITAKSNTTVRLFEKGLPEDESITQRYMFTKDTDYTAMAAKYREYLMDKYPDMKKQESAELPVAVEYVGAVDNIEQILGIPVTRPQILTSYKDAKAMTEELVNAGFTNMNLKYTGWYNKGVEQQSAQKVNLVSRLGSKSSFEDLTGYAKQNGINMYLDSYFNLVFKNGMFDGFGLNRDCAKFLNRERCELDVYSPIYYTKDVYSYKNSYYMVKPSYALSSIDNFKSSIDKLGASNISFEDVGSMLGADYNSKDRVSREAVLSQQQQKLSQLKSEGRKLMIQNGNAYALPYTDFVTDIAVSSKKLTIIDETVPFYEIAIHGLVNYAAQPINESQDYQENLLKSIETGSGLYYLFMNASAEDLQNGRFTKYYSAQYSLWKDSAVQTYSELKKNLSGIYNQFIVKHEQVAPGVYMTQYENGMKTYVNYNYTDYNLNGKTIAKRGYIVEGGGQ